LLYSPTDACSDKRKSVMNIYSLTFSLSHISVSGALCQITQNSFSTFLDHANHILKIKPSKTHCEYGR